MRLNLEENKELCMWLMDCGLSIHQCAEFITDLEECDSFATALFNISKRKQTYGELL